MSKIDLAFEAVLWPRMRDIQMAKGERDSIAFIIGLLSDVL